MVLGVQSLTFKFHRNQLLTHQCCLKETKHNIAFLNAMCNVNQADVSPLTDSAPDKANIKTKLDLSAGV